MIENIFGFVFIIAIFVAALEYNLKNQVVPFIADRYKIDKFNLKFKFYELNAMY